MVHLSKECGRHNFLAHILRLTQNLAVYNNFFLIHSGDSFFYSLDECDFFHIIEHFFIC